MNNSQLDNQEHEQSKNINNEKDIEYSEGNKKKVTIVRLFLSILGLLIAGFCYLILDWKLPAGILFLIIILINYMETKKEYEVELKKLEKLEKKKIKN